MADAGSAGALAFLRELTAGESLRLTFSAAPGWEKEDNSATATSIMENSILYSSGKDPDQTLYKTAVTAELYRK